MDPLPPIPTPPAKRWREFRIRVLPLLMFGVMVVMVVVLWTDFVQPVTVVGEVEALQATLSSPQSGTVHSLSVDRFSRVKQGQVVGQILSLNPNVPTPLEAPADGMVSALMRRPGEEVMRGDPILTISSGQANRIVGYVRQPVSVLPSTNDTVIITTRARPRQKAEARILEVGAQMEPVRPGLFSPDRNSLESGLPILVSLPPGLRVTPGEYVDLAIKPASRR